MELVKALPRPRLGGYGVYGNHDHVSYSHNAMLARNWERYQKENGKSLNGHKPALIHQVREFYAFARFFMNMPFVLKRVRFNNKELLRRTLAAHGIEILNNQAIPVCHRPGEPDGVDLYLAGVDDVAEGWPDIGKALMNVPEDKTVILLSHNPDILEEPAAQRADVILSGHTHGGQIVLPLVGAIHTHSAQLARHEAAGMVRRGKTQIYITRGVGEGIPLRFCARPQITLITLKAK
jgi:predicted MPP superfamily phosphohydrolase